MLQELNDGRSYVLNLDIALNSPKILDITEKPCAQKLIIPFDVYNSKLYLWESDDNDRGASSVELANYLSAIVSHSKKIPAKKGKKDCFEYRFPDGEVIILDPNRHNCPSNSSTRRTIACARDWDAVIATFKPSVYNIAAEEEKVEAYLIKPEPYKGYRTVLLPFDLIYQWKNNGFTADEWELHFADELPLRPNEFVEFIFEKPERPNNFNNIGMFNPKTGHLDHLKTRKKWPKTISPASPRQAMAFEALFTDPNRIPIVIFDGKGGSGKTFAAMVCAITESNELKDENSFKPAQQHPSKNKHQESRQTKKERRAQNAELQMLSELSDEELRNYYREEESKKQTSKKKGQSSSIPDADSKEQQSAKNSHIYREVWICPPDKMLGDKMPAVPGDEYKKQRGKMNGIAKNVETIFKLLYPNLSYRDAKEKTEDYLRKCIVTSPGEINGDDISDAIFIVDEAQFMLCNQIRMSMQRINYNAKIVICGDPTQRMNQYGAVDNSLRKAEEKVKFNPGVAIITFDKRDEIQRLGAKIVDECWPE